MRANRFYGVDFQVSANKQVAKSLLDSFIIYLLSPHSYHWSKSQFYAENKYILLYPQTIFKNQVDPKMKKLIILSLIFISHFAFGQNPTTKGDAKIVGTVIDSLSNNPIEFGTVSLFKLPNLQQPIDGAMTDDKGKFELKDLAYGDYVIRFSFIGYPPKMTDPIELRAEKKVANVGNLLLAPNAKMLEEVAVTGQAAMIEEKVDRLVYNAEKDITSKGSDASEVLRKVPLLTVDLDGNVSVRGSSNIRVLINNKPSTIMASSVADALKQIPADQVKTVEVITSPSAKYDAEGTTGIINIITKKNNIEGYQLGIDLGGGNRGANLGLNGSLRTGKVGFTLGGWGRYGFNPTETEFYQNTYSLTDTTYVTSQNGDGDDKMYFGRYNLGADYDISKNKSLSAGVRFGSFSFDRKQDLKINEFKEYGGKVYSSQHSGLDVRNKMPNMSWDFNLDYLHIIKPQQEFSISTLYSITNSKSEFDRILKPGYEGVSIENDNNSKNQEFTLQTDYMTPIKKNQIFEVGAKGIFRTVNSDFENRINGSMQDGFLNYSQNIAAGYLSYTYSTKSKYTFKVGGRYEYTFIDATARAAGSDITNDLDISSYGNFIPSVNIAKTFAQKYTVKLAYNQRIQRPGMQHLNPNENITNPQRISRGNPELEPEVSNNFEASVSGALGKTYLNFSVFTRQTDDAISSITRNAEERGEGVTLTTFENVGRSSATGVNLFSNIQVTPKWSVNGGVEFFHQNFRGLAPALEVLSKDFFSEGWNLNGRIMTTVSLNKGWQVQGFGFLRGKQPIAQGFQGGFGHYSLGFRKEFANKKGSIGLNAQNFLANKMRFVTSELDTYQNWSKSVDYRYNMGINATFSYKIGKMGPDVMRRRRAKGVQNDDVKQGSSQAQQAQN